MDRREFMNFAAALRTYYPKEKLLPNKESIELWFDALMDIDYQTASNTLKRWVATERWSPSVADIRAGAVYGEVQDWTGGWNEVTSAISKYGSWNQKEALESMSPVTRQCVQSIGWENICKSENISVERGHFRTMYEARTERLAKVQQTPAALRSPTEKLLLEFGEKLKLN